MDTNLNFVRIITLFAILSGSFRLEAQTYKLQWQGTKSLPTSDGRIVPILSFTEAAYPSEKNHLPIFKISFDEHIEKFGLKNTVFQILPPNEKASADTVDIGTSAKVSIIEQKWRGQTVSEVNIIPLRRNAATGQLEKLVSFETTYTKVKSTNKTAQFQGYQSTDVSVLATGTWHKLAITQSGMYKIDRSFLQNMGFNVGSINPKKIKIYGNGGGMLPQANAAPRAEDLVENAIFVAGETDGSFDNGDYVMFYAQGASKWNYNAGNKLYTRENNIYSDTTYYFFTVGDTDGLRVENRANGTLSSTHINTFSDYFFYEQDRFSAQRSGRTWYGEVFDLTLDREFNFPIEGLNTQIPAYVKVSIMASASSSTEFGVTVNGIPQSTKLGVGGRGTYDYGFNAESTYPINFATLGNPSNISVKLSYGKNGNSSAVGYLNYIEVNASRRLAFYGNQTAFRHTTTGNQLTTFAMANADANVQIWDISNPLKPVSQGFNIQNDSTLFAANIAQRGEFIAFKNPNAFATPQWAGRIGNQNLHGLASPDLLIITHPNFLEEAQRLASFRETNDGLSVVVATTTQIYNEFSSGSQDLVALRDFARFLYKKTATPKLKYVLLFGDCSFDYKRRTPNNTNFVPIYESSNSLNEIDSFCSDDFIAFMDETEGAWGANTEDRMDLGIGRLPVANLLQAKQVVDKLMAYANKSSLGAWRNRISYVADDGDDFLHQGQSDGMANSIITSNPDYNVNKIFLASYPLIATPSGSLSPATRSAVSQAVEGGSLIVNYTGHGSKIQWAQESILTLEQVNSWKNINNMPLFITATCDFGLYDDPAVMSGGESIMLNPLGGGIGLITATRKVYADKNLLFNIAFYRVAFKNVNGQQPRLGDVMMSTKNNSLEGQYNKGFALIGDPSMQLAYPKEDVVITKINGQSLSDTTIVVDKTIRALQKVTFEGEIRGNQQKIDNFNGTLYATIFDKPVKITIEEKGEYKTFETTQNIVYNGRAKVTNGSFSFTFVTPKDISYLLGDGKLSMYAKQDSSTLDANGSEVDLLIGGSDDNAALDDTPPSIRLFINDTTFTNGGLTNGSPTFLAKLADDNGINVSTTGIGHEMTAILDNDEDNLFLMNNFYLTEANSYQKGEVRYPFKDLSEGLHTIRFKAWDTHNNSSEAEISFLVTSNPGLVIAQIFNYPNPFNTETFFVFEHNKAGQDLNVKVEIFNYVGQIVKSIEAFVPQSEAKVDLGSKLKWDGRNSLGEELSSGVYLYRVNVSSSDGTKTQKVDKLVIVR